MKKLLLIVTFIICSLLSVPSLVYAADDPCQDSVYQELKDKDMEKMSDREYKTFERLSRSCSTYKSQSSIVENTRNSWFQAYGVYLGGLLLFLLIL